MFDICKFFIQCNKDSYYEHMKIGVNNIYMGVSVYWPLSVLCVFACVCL